MVSFQLNDMTRDHCVGTIAKALKAVTATVRFDLAERRVDIQSGKADAAELSAAIRQAGYTPVQVEGVGVPMASILQRHARRAAEAGRLMPHVAQR